MTKEMWVTVLNLLAALLIGAMKLLPVPAELIPWLTFIVFAINLILTIVFGVPAIRGLVRGWLAAHAAPKARP